MSTYLPWYHQWWMVSVCAPMLLVVQVGIARWIAKRSYRAYKRLDSAAEAWAARHNIRERLSTLGDDIGYTILVCIAAVVPAFTIAYALGYWVW